MRGRRAGTLLVAAVLVTVGACTPKGAKKAEEEGNKRALTPTYAPASSAPSTSAVVNATGTVPSTETSSAAVPPTPTTTSGTAASAPVTVSLTDPTGDVTPSPVDRPPPWADLVGADLTFDGSSFTLKVHLGGGQAPSDIDGNHTMNIGSFYDVNGDGQVDQEVWANLVYGGWGGAWFDDQKHTASFVDNSKVTVTVEGDAVVLRFPLDHVNADSFRWSVASEWGSYAVIGTVAAARDDCPDNDQPASFPG